MTHPAAYACSAPYPPIAVEGPNPMYAQMLSLPLASSQGELNAITQYVYQSWGIRPRDPLLAEMLLQLSMVEMHHMDILGQLIVLLGGIPRFQALCPPACPMWNARMLNYSCDIKIALQVDIRGEECAYHTYQALAKKIPDRKVSTMLTRIALDEARHLELLEDAIARLC